MTTQQMLDDRYGRRRGGGPRAAILAGVLISLAVAGAAWFAAASSAGATQATTTAFTTVDEHRVEVEFQVSAPSGSSLACILEAQDEEHGIVGWKVVEYPAAPELSRPFRESVPTVATATTGLVNSCWVT
jgi:hypothetical protein